LEGKDDFILIVKQIEANISDITITNIESSHTNTNVNNNDGVINYIDAVNDYNDSNANLLEGAEWWNDVVRIPSIFTSVVGNGAGQ